MGKKEFDEESRHGKRFGQVPKNTPEAEIESALKKAGVESISMGSQNSPMTLPGPKEEVDHPAHYGGKDNPYETIKVLENTLTTEEFIGFLKGNVFKYNDRAKAKADGSKEKQDYEKAHWYQTYLLGFLKRTYEKNSHGKQSG